jgi:hypothetical protein
MRIKKNYVNLIDGIPTDPFFIDLCDVTNSYGIKRTDTNAVVVKVNTSVVKVSTGVYEYDISSLPNFIPYIISWRFKQSELGVYEYWTESWNENHLGITRKGLRDFIRYLIKEQETIDIVNGMETVDGAFWKNEYLNVLINSHIKQVFEKINFLNDNSMKYYEKNYNLKKETENEILNCLAPQVLCYEDDILQTYEECYLAIAYSVAGQCLRESNDPVSESMELYKLKYIGESIDKIMKLLLKKKVSEENE